MGYSYYFQENEPGVLQSKGLWKSQTWTTTFRKPGWSLERIVIEVTLEAIEPVFPVLLDCFGHMCYRSIWFKTLCVNSKASQRNWGHYEWKSDQSKEAKFFSFASWRQAFPLKKIDLKDIIYSTLSIVNHSALYICQMLSRFKSHLLEKKKESSSGRKRI